MSRLAAETEADSGLEDHQSHCRCRLWPAAARRAICWPPTRLVEVSLGDRRSNPNKWKQGPGSTKSGSCARKSNRPWGEITVTKTDPGVAWGSVHWQYLEDMSKITPYEGTPLTLKKQLFIKENTKKGPVLNAVDGPISVGDELVVRIELRSIGIWNMCT